MARDVSDDTKQTIGEMLKRFRQKKLWSQADLAHRIGTTPVSVGRWENNITRPNLHFQQQLCEIFAKSPEELGFLPQTELKHEEVSEGDAQQSKMEPGLHAKATFHERTSGDFPLSPVSPAPRPRVHVSRNSVMRRWRSVLIVLICLVLFLLLGGLFLSRVQRRSTLSSTSQLPSCQTPSSQESAMTIYTQVMCHQARISSALSQQDGLKWDESSQCRFQQGAYHVLLPASEYVAECFAHGSSLGPSFALQVDMTVLKGNSGGLVFRAQGPSSNWDVIVSRIPIDIWGQYNFFLAGNNAPCHLSTEPNAPGYCFSPHGTITYGTGVTNTMTVIALGARIYLYVNGLFIDQSQAPASSQLTGFLGVFANGYHSTGEVAFRHLQIWNL